MTAICENCGEEIKEGMICSCERERVKEEIKNRQKRYTLPAYKVNGEEDIIGVILSNRGIEEKDLFMNTSVDNLLNDTFLNEKAAISRIIKAIEGREKIGIYGDYDADGITGCALGILTLQKLGADVTYHINDRFKEGFGINPLGVEELHKKNVSLIITVDNGIAGVDGVKKAKELGMDVIVTDHHEPNEELPETVIIDPKQKGCLYPNKDITGVGVLFKILLRVCEHYDRKNLALKQLDLVALGTVADMAPLIDENRVIVKNGLTLFNWEKGRKQFKILKEKLSIHKPIGVYELGFMIAPILNAESRLFGKPNMAIEFFLTEDEVTINLFAEKLVEINNKRKKMLEDELAIADEEVNTDKEILFIYHPRIEEGIAGLVATRLMEAYNRPTIILGKSSNGYLKGSGRSNKGFNLKENLDKVSKFLLHYGGHAEACGLSIEEGNLVIVKNLLETEGKTFFKNYDGEEKIYALDLEIEEADLTKSLIKSLETLEPFGIGFKKPRFLLKNVQVGDISILKEAHSKFKSNGVDFLCFGRLMEEGTYHLVGYPSLNVFRGRESVQFMIEDVIGEENLVEN